MLKKWIVLMIILLMFGGNFLGLSSKDDNWVPENNDSLNDNNDLPFDVPIAPVVPENDIELEQKAISPEIGVFDLGDISTPKNSPKKSLSIVFGTENKQYPGQGLGYIGGFNPNYTSLDKGYMYNYKSGSIYEHRGWAVFNLSNFKLYSGLKITSGQIVYRQDYRYYATSQDFWTMKSIPYETNKSSVAKTWYNEIGGNGSIKLGSESFSKVHNLNNFDHVVPISTNGINEFNNRLTSSKYNFAFGGNITSFYKGYTYGYIHCLDVRLYLNFTCDKISNNLTGELVLGDELSGYVSPSYIYDIGRIYSHPSYGGFAVWNTTRIKKLIPKIGPHGENITLTGLSVRLNSPYGYYQYNKIYNMSNDPRTSNASTIYSDVRSGIRYFYWSRSGSYVSTARGFDWDLGKNALIDFIDILNSTQDFFVLGFTQTSNYLYLYSPKLVVKWSIIDPLVELNYSVGYEGSDIFFNANKSLNCTGGKSFLRYDWDWENDGRYDESTTTPYINKSWADDYRGNISLRVNDTLRGKNASRIFLVIVKNLPPDVNAGLDQTVYVNSNVSFSGNYSDPGIKDTHTISWSFDDGNSSNGSLKPTHVYTTTGIFNVTLNVTDDDGGMGLDYLIITVINKTKPNSTGNATATIDIDPNTLNLKSKGRWITCYIELSSGYNVSQINLSTVKIIKIANKTLSTPIYAESHPSGIGDHDSDSIADLMVKFDRSEVQKVSPVGDKIRFDVAFKLLNGTAIQGYDIIRVISKGK